MTDQAKTIADGLYELIKEYRGVPESEAGTAAGVLTVRETWLFDRAVSISRASQGSRVGTAELVARGMWQVAIAFGTKTGAFDEDTAISASGDDWHQYLPDAEKLITEHSALSPPATPQAPEDVRSSLATQVTVTMEECRLLSRNLVSTLYEGASEGTRVRPTPQVVAEALRHVLPGRIQIAGEPS